MPVKMTELALIFLVPVHLVRAGLGLADDLGVVSDTQKPEPGHYREQLVSIPVAWKVLELGKVVIKKVVLWLKLLDTAGGVELLNVFAV